MTSATKYSHNKHRNEFGFLLRLYNSMFVYLKNEQYLNRFKKHGNQLHWRKCNSHIIRLVFQTTFFEMLKYSFVMVRLSKSVVSTLYVKLWFLFSFPSYLELLVVNTDNTNSVTSHFLNFNPQEVKTVMH